MANIVDARGKACPQPVIETKKALQAQGAPVITLVDNDIARQNIEKMAAQMGLSAASDVMADGTIRIVLQPVGADVLGSVLGNGAAPLSSSNMHQELQPCGPMDCTPLAAAGPTVVLLASNCMGSGDDALGAALMKGFVYALTQMNTAPDTVLLFNGGAKLSSEGAETVADLRVLAENGTEILTCGTCLNHYGLTDKLAVGEVTNMYVITEKLMQAGKVIRP